MKRKNLHWVYSIPMQNHLWARGVRPVLEDDVSGAAGYKKTAEFREALESFYIEHVYFKNKH